MSENTNEELVECVCSGIVRNRNEVRVIRAMERFLEERGIIELSEKDRCDIYAFALNVLPARYVQKGTIVLRDPVRDSTVEKAVLAAYERVTFNPKD